MSTAIGEELARTNIDAQQADDPIGPDRPDHPEAPLPGDQAASRSPTCWATKHRARLAAAAGAARLLAGGLRRR